MKRFFYFLLFTLALPIAAFSNSPPNSQNFCINTLDMRNFTTFLDLNDCKLTDKDMPAIYDYIAHLKYKEDLQGLSLGNNFLTDNSVSELVRHTELKYLVLSNNQISKKGLLALAQSNHLIALAINKVGLDDDVAIMLSKNTGIEELYVADNKLTVKGTLALASDALLDTLVLNGNPIDHECIIKLAKHPNLSRLDVANTNLQDTDAELLAKNSSLKMLKLDSNHLSKAIASTFANNQNIERLSLNDNNLGDDGARILAGSKKLDYLGLGKNKITAVGAEALAMNEYLYSIDLYDNTLSDKGALDIINSSKGRWGYLNFSNTQITTAGAIALTKAISKPMSLNLSHNPIGNAAASSLINEFYDATYSYHNCLNISYTQINDDGLEQLKPNRGHIGSCGLALNGNHITKKGLLGLMHFYAKKNGGQLYIGDNALGDTGAEEFLDAIIPILDIRNNHVTENMVKKLLSNEYIWILYWNEDGNNHNSDFDHSMPQLFKSTILKKTHRVQAYT